MIWTTILAALCCATPSGEVRAALLDLKQHVPAESRLTTRYVTFYALPESQWSSGRAVVSFVLNSVSRSSVIVVPDVVPGSRGRLLRIDVARLARRKEDLTAWLRAWEHMVEDDPYFHLKTVVLDPRDGKRRTVLTDGGWVNLARAAKLRRFCGSSGAIVRADWFVSRACVTPLYYEFAGIPERKEPWLRRLGIDAKTIVRLDANRGANLLRSRVTDKPRRLSRWSAPHGAVWNTYDSDGLDQTKDVFRNPTFAVGFDAGEHIATRANGLLEYALFNARGVRQDAVPPEIAIDDTVSPPVPLVPMLSCVRCHAADGGDGLRSFADDQSRLLADGVELLVQDGRQLQSLESFYGRQRRLKRELQRDREDYREAVAQATGGMTPAKIAAALAGMFRAYVTEEVTLERAAREVGLTAERFRVLMGRSVDPLLLALVEGIPIRPAQWEASYAAAAILAASADNSEDEPGQLFNGQDEVFSSGGEP